MKPGDYVGHIPLMTLKLSELTRIVQEFPRPIHAGERRLGIQYPPPDLEMLRSGTLMEMSFKEFVFESVVYYMPGGHNYHYRWKLVTPAQIVFDIS